jgi:hypothetical protein
MRDFLPASGREASAHGVRAPPEAFMRWAIQEILSVDSRIMARRNVSDDELRNFLRNRSRHNQCVPASRRRFLRHARIAIGIIWST